MRILFAILALLLSLPVPGEAGCDPGAAAGAAADCDPCGSCPCGSSACIGTFLPDISRGDRSLGLAVAEHTTCYEAPSFPFLRPPEPSV